MSKAVHQTGSDLRDLTQSGAAGAWLWDAEGGRVLGDARFAMLYGMDAASAASGVPTSAFFEAIHPDDRMRIRIAVAAVMHGAELFEKEYRILAADEVRWVRARGRAEHALGGGLLRFSGLLNDITEQKRVQEQLRIAQSAGGVGTFEYVSGFGTATVSEQFCRLLGLHPAESLPIATINGLVRREDGRLVGAASASSSGPAYSEHRILRADDGSERWIACRGEHRTDGPASSHRFIGVIYDITENKKREAKLTELAQELEQRVEVRTQERDRIWKISRDLMLVVDADGVYQAVNPAWSSMLGWSEAELTGIEVISLAHPDDQARGREILAAVRRGEAVQGAELRVRARDGSYRWIDWTVVPAEGEVYATGRDITERRMLEEQLRQSQKMEAVGQLTGGLAHDLNNMLTGIIGGMDLMRRRLAAGRNGDAERFMEAATASAERAAALTHRLLAFSRRQSLDTRPVAVNELIGSIEDMLRRTLGEQINLQVTYAPESWMALSDSSQLESAVLNLAINARDAMPEGGRLTIEIERVELAAGRVPEMTDLEPGAYIVVSVSDTGSGMPQAVIDKAFDPFFTTKPVGQGTGLGLSMVYGFMRQTGGHVSIYSEEGRGTSVKLYLRQVEDGASRFPEAPAQLELPRGRGETVLLVEDDPSVRMLVREVLDELGYTAIEATDAESALKALKQAPKIDLLVTDVGLPGANGRQLAEIIRQDRAGLPVLFMTGYAANAAVRGDFLAPGMDMISKPFAVDALAHKVRAMMGEG